jgi:hypothetical protein
LEEKMRDHLTIGIKCIQRTAAISVLATLLTACTITIPGTNPGVISSTMINSVEIKRNAYFNTLPTEELQKKRIFIQFVDSPKATKLLQNILTARGFDVVATPEEATAQITFNGAFSVGKFAMKPTQGKLGELLESGMTVSDTPNQTQTGLINAILFPTDWLSRVTGVHDSFNKMITGDPRGWCLHEDCDKFISEVGIFVTGDSGHWRLNARAKNEKIALDLVVKDAIEAALQPLYDVAPLKDSKIR